MMPFFLGHNEPFLAQTMANIEMIDTAEFGIHMQAKTRKEGEGKPLPTPPLCKENYTLPAQALLLGPIPVCQLIGIAKEIGGHRFP